MTEPKITFLVRCADGKGIIAKITSFFYREGFNILSCQQFTDTIEQAYFMRISLDARDLQCERELLEDRFHEVASPLGLRWKAYYTEDVQQIALLASKTNHCIYDLLEKYSEGKLHCRIPLIIGNHDTVRPVADQFGIPFHLLHITRENWPEKELEILSLLDRYSIDLVVLARFMRILSPAFISRYKNRIINIHHAFLPAFQGASPYRRAYERGVKMIGATAHYATDDLDEGPIIEQDVDRVSHTSTPRGLTRIGSDIERKVLSRAVQFHLDRRIIVHGRRTIVFPESND